jgi:hypothetical protein
LNISDHRTLPRVDAKPMPRRPAPLPSQAGALLTRASPASTVWDLPDLTVTSSFLRFGIPAPLAARITGMAAAWQQHRPWF